MPVDLLGIVAEHLREQNVPGGIVEGGIVEETNSQVVTFPTKGQVRALADLHSGGGIGIQCGTINHFGTGTGEATITSPTIRLQVECRRCSIAAPSVRGIIRYHDQGPELNLMDPIDPSDDRPIRAHIHRHWLHIKDTIPGWGDNTPACLRVDCCYQPEPRTSFYTVNRVVHPEDPQFFDQIDDWIKNVVLKKDVQNLVEQSCDQCPYRIPTSTAAGRCVGAGSNERRDNHGNRNN